MIGRIYFRVTLSCMVFTLMGCAHSGRGSFGTYLGDEPPKVGIPASAKIMERELNQSVLQKALSNSDKIRLVQVFSSQSETPQYRVFGIEKGGIYEALDIQNADVVLGAAGYAVMQPKNFVGYISLLPNEKEGSILIRRGQADLLYRYKING